MLATKLSNWHAALALFQDRKYLFEWENDSLDHFLIHSHAKFTLLHSNSPSIIMTAKILVFNTTFLGGITDFRQGNPKAQAKFSFALALASGRGFCQNQRSTLLSLASY